LSNDSIDKLVKKRLIMDDNALWRKEACFLRLLFDLFYSNKIDLIDYFQFQKIGV
jgi:hypothetical protein